MVGAALVAASGAIHLDLALSSYGHIPTIGVLFLAQAAAAFALAIAVVVVRRPLVLVAGVLLLLATLGGYVLALVVGLFGFHELRTTAGIAAAAVEIAGAGALGLGAGLSAQGVFAPWRYWGAVAAVVVAAAAVGPALAEAAVPVPSASRGAASVESLRLGRFGAVLATVRHASLYLLSSEAGGRIVCRGACLSIWPPLLVSSSVRHVVAGPGIAGHLGLVARSRTTKQVTDNGYPLYTYAGDSGPREANGEGIVSFGGTWYLVRASARTPGTTPVR